MLIRPPSRTGAAAWRRRGSAVVRLLKEGIEGTRQGQGGERRRRGVKGFIHFPDELDIMFVCRVCTIRACTCVQWGVMYDVCILLLLLIEYAYSAGVICIHSRVRWCTYESMHTTTLEEYSRSTNSYDSRITVVKC